MDQQSVSSRVVNLPYKFRKYFHPDTYVEMTLIHHPSTLRVLLQEPEEPNFILHHIKEASEILASAGYVTLEYGDFITHEDLPTWRQKTK